MITDVKEQNDFWGLFGISVFFDYKKIRLKNFKEKLIVNIRYFHIKMFSYYLISVKIRTGASGKEDNWTMKKNLANIITSLRLVGALVLTGFDISSTAFLVIYGICGLSDAVDGFVARKLHAESEFGSKLDSVSDLLLYSMMLIKIWPHLALVLPKIGLYMIMALLGSCIKTLQIYTQIYIHL